MSTPVTKTHSSQRLPGEAEPRRGKRRFGTNLWQFEWENWSIHPSIHPYIIIYVYVFSDEPIWTKKQCLKTSWDIMGNHGGWGDFLRILGVVSCCPVWSAGSMDLQSRVCNPSRNPRKLQNLQRPGRRWSPSSQAQDMRRQFFWGSGGRDYSPQQTIAAAGSNKPIAREDSCKMS